VSPALQSAPKGFGVSTAGTKMSILKEKRENFCASAAQVELQRKFAWSGIRD